MHFTSLFSHLNRLFTFNGHEASKSMVKPCRFSKCFDKDPQNSTFGLLAHVNVNRFDAYSDTMQIRCDKPSTTAALCRGRELPRGYFCSVTPP
jgi:hypothetical protein